MQTVPVRVGEIEVLVEVAPVAGTEPTSLPGQKAMDYVTGAFERAQSAVEEIAVSTARTVGRVGRRVGPPKTVEVEFGLKVSAKGDVIVAGVSGEACLKVTIAYGFGSRNSAEENESDRNRHSNIESDA